MGWNYRLIKQRPRVRDPWTVLSVMGMFRQLTLRIAANLLPFVDLPPWLLFFTTSNLRREWQLDTKDHIHTCPGRDLFHRYQIAIVLLVHGLWPRTFARL